MNRYPLFLCGLAVASVLFQPAAQAQATNPPNIPQNATPGAILQHQIRTQQMQQEFPWLNRPIAPIDVAPPQGPIINESNIQGEIMGPSPTLSPDTMSNPPGSFSP
jgi:hypothetical protein